MSRNFLRHLCNREALSWALYDWGNSAFATTVIAGFFPIFFKEIVQADVPAAESTVRLGILSSIVGILVGITSPLLGAYADAHSRKKLLLLLFTIVGCIGTAALYSVSSSNWLTAATVYGIALIGFHAAIVFYDSLLPAAAEGNSLDVVSSFGYSLGYLGGGVLFLLSVVFYNSPESYGFADTEAVVRSSFLMVALWWFLFSLPLLFFLKEQPAPLDHETVLRQLWNTLRSVAKNKTLLLFLFGYWLYIDGVNTVVKMALDYGLSIGFNAADLVSALLITQFVGFPSALVFGYLAKYAGAKRMILAGLLCYCGVTCWASLMQNRWEFYGIAILIGLVQGGVQALSRSLYASMVPRDRSAEFFSFFNLVGKFATILGPLLIAAVTYYSGSTRIGLASLTFLFLVGGGLLFAVPNERKA